MALIFDGPVAPDALTAFAREVPSPAGNTLSSMVPTQTVPDNRVNLAAITKTNRVARFRAFDGRIHTSERNVAAESFAQLPPVSSSLNMGEYERLQLEFARTGGTNRSAMVDAVYNDTEQLVGEVHNRLELALGQVMTTGKLVIDEEGYQGEADFGVTPDQNVSAATVWSNPATATALTDLINWRQVMVSKGQVPGRIITSDKVRNLLLRNAEIIAAVAGTHTGRTMVSVTELNSLLASFNIPIIETTVDNMLDVDGTATRVFDADHLVMTALDLGSVFGIATGITATALELVDSRESGMAPAGAPGIVAVINKVGPPLRKFTYVDAVAMPVIRDARALLIAKVA